MRNFIVILAPFLPLLAIAQQQPSLLCGNGRVDPGEECDPVATGFSTECCTSECRYAPQAKSCYNGSGVCKLGQCVTRALDCTSIKLDAPLQYEAGAPSINGPFESCKLDSIPANDTSPAGMNSTMISSLLPAHMATQTQCSRVCAGKTIEGREVCVDFNKVPNVNAVTFDYLPCAVDQSAKVDFQAFVGAQESDRDYESILKPGVCVTGVCRPDICDATRCNGRGTCTLAQSTKAAIDTALGVSSSNPLVATGNLGLVRCTCNAGWMGAHCDISTTGGTDDPDPSGATGDVEPIDPTDEETIDALCKQASDKRVQEAILTSILSTIASCVILVLLLICCVRYFCFGGGNKDDEGEKSDTESLLLLKKKSEEKGKRRSVLSDIVIAPVPVEKDKTRDRAATSTSPLRELEELPAINSVGNLDLDTDALLRERESSHTIEEGDEDSSSVEIASMAALSQLEAEEATKADLTVPGKPDVLLPANYLRAAYLYNARLADEIHLLPGDILYLIKAYDDGWAKAYNLRSGREGIFPLSFTKRIVLKDASESIQNFAKGGVFSGSEAESQTGSNIEVESRRESGIDK